MHEPFVLRVHGSVALLVGHLCGSLSFRSLSISHTRTRMDNQLVNMYCINCDENVAFENGDDGFFYCHMCVSQSQDVVDTTGLGDHLFLSGIYNHAHMWSQPKIKTEPRLTQTQTQFFPPPTITKQEKAEEQKPYSFEDESSVPLDFGNQWMNQAPLLDDETVVKSLRLRYVQGIQVMIQLQCQVLVERFSVSPAICGLSGVLWLQYISVSRVFDKDWAKDTILDSEEAFHGRVDATQLQKFDSWIENKVESTAIKQPTLI